MSSHASAVTVELPRWPLADRLALALVPAAGLVVEVVLARHPGAPAGWGVAACLLLVGTLWLQRRRRPRAVVLGPEGGCLRFGDGAEEPCRPGHGTRLLGAGVVLHWQGRTRSGSLWLTPADLTRAELRRLAVRLVAGGRVARAPDATVAGR